uniref:Uncharacterized protein n=1 Tax=Rhizophora mucronata TaxID=61149 RepID=A0A2P2MX21_RHIMU
MVVLHRGSNQYILRRNLFNFISYKSHQ